jgi:hypothetical protein
MRKCWNIKEVRNRIEMTPYRAVWPGEDASVGTLQHGHVDVLGRCKDFIDIEIISTTWHVR